MERIEATFEIESKTDAVVVRRLVERIFDSIREESRKIPGGDASPNQMLQQFEAIREASRHQSPGSLTVIFERRDEPFNE